jgi:hypothetical protein
VQLHEEAARNYVDDSLQDLRGMEDQENIGNNDEYSPSQLQKRKHMLKSMSARGNLINNFVA